MSAGIARPDFTPAERHLVNGYLHRDVAGAWFWTAYLIPSAAFFVYGFWNDERIAAAIGWAGTMALMIWLVASANRNGARLRTVLEKYERSLEDTAPDERTGTQRSRAGA